jgi:phosphoribosylformylglycinamidine synthase subunit PurL
VQATVVGKVTDPDATAWVGCASSTGSTGPSWPGAGVVAARRRPAVRPAARRARRPGRARRQHPRRPPIRPTSLLDLLWRHHLGVSQYDHQLFLNTVEGPGGDAVVLRLKHPITGADTGRGMALTTDGNHRWCAVDPREGTASWWPRRC